MFRLTGDYHNYFPKTERGVGDTIFSRVVVGCN